MDPIALLIALLISFLWGLSPIIHKTVLYKISPHTALVLSSVFYTICTVGYAIYYKDEIIRDCKELNIKVALGMAFTAIVCGFVANVLYFDILKKYDSHIISALIYSAPLFTLVLAYLLLNEHITKGGLFGVLLISSGVVVLAYNRTSS